MSIYECPRCGSDEFYKLYKGVEEAETISFDEDGEIEYGDLETFLNDAYISHIACECGYVFTTAGGRAITDEQELKTCMEEGKLDVPKD
jgi:hypothetical protein